VVEKRKKKRHSVGDFVKESNLLDKIYLEIDMKFVIRARVLDLSLNGIGFEIDEMEQAEKENFEKMSTIFVKIFFDSEVIFAEVEKVWSIITVVDEREVLRGGFQFTVIASEDRIKLSKIIEEIRETR
jgi:hypothetical protein